MAEVVGITCPLCSGTAPTSPGPFGGSQTVAGYLNPHWMVGTNVTTTLAPVGTPGGGDTVSFQLSIKFTDAECDSYPDVMPKPVINFVRAKYFDPTLGGDITVQSPPAIALFAAPEPCDFKVTKVVTDGSLKIVFGQNVHYTVTYQNLNAQPVTIGTMIDALRLVQPNYAWPLAVHYDYSCTESGGVTGFSGVGGTFPFFHPPATVQVVPTSLPQQGVRIIQNLAPVLFPGNSSVTCDVRISVDPPSPGAPLCARVGSLENAAIMDQSALYNPNFPWGNTNPGFYDAVSLPLPACFDLVVNKRVDPIWTTQTGGPLAYDLMISNPGDPIGPADGVSVSDTFTPLPNLASSSGTQCTDSAGALSSPVPYSPGPSDCDFSWLTPPSTGNPSTLNIQALSTDWSAHGLFQVPGPFPAPPGQICNDAEVTVAGAKAIDPLTHPDWYARDPSTWKTHRCVPVFNTSDLKIVKTVDIVAPALPPPPTSFNVTVTCSFSPYYNSINPFTFNYPPASIPLGVVHTIPNNSICTIGEQGLSTTPIANRGCPSGLAAWGPITYPNAIGPDGTPQSVTVGGGSSDALQVHNTFACLETGRLIVDKKVTNNTNASLAGWHYPVTVSCNGRPDAFPSLVVGQSLPFNNIPVGTLCHVAEAWQNLPVPADQRACPPGTHPAWQPAVYTPANVVIAGQPVTVTVENVLDCVKPEKPTVGTLTVVKKVTNNTSADLSDWKYPVNVTCDGGPDASFNLLDGHSDVVNNIPLGIDCKVGEDSLPLPDKGCPRGTVPQWTTTRFCGL